MENIYDSQINTFTGGMNLDTDPLFVKEDQYREAYNFRLTKSVDAITGVLENSVGNRKIISLSHIIDKDFEIVGHCVIRNYIVLFVRRVYAGNNGKYIIDSKIIRINTTPEQGRDIYSEIPLSNIVAIYEDSDSLGRFNFGHIIKCVGRWVNDKNVKVYWTDFYHDDRPEPHLKDFDDSERAPLMSYNIVDDSNKNKSVSYFNQTITAILNTPYDLSLISGGLRSGVYQYIYRIITDDGSSSNWSSPSILFPVSSNYGKDDANDYWDSEDVQIGSTNDVKKSNHGVQISIDIPNIDSAQRIEVCRIYYAGTTSNPKYYKIKIRENIETGEIGKVKIVTDTVDDGVEIASFTQSGKDPSYGVASDNINICAKDIVSNRDTLYAANIKEISFVKNINDSNFEEFDTRAYRFNDFGECWLWSLSDIYNKDINFSYNCILIRTKCDENEQGIPQDAIKIQGAFFDDYVDIYNLYGAGLLYEVYYIKFPISNILNLNSVNNIHIPINSFSLNSYKKVLIDGKNLIFNGPHDLTRKSIPYNFDCINLTNYVTAQDYPMYSSNKFNINNTNYSDTTKKDIDTSIGLGCFYKRSQLAPNFQYAWRNCRYIGCGTYTENKRPIVNIPGGVGFNVRYTFTTEKSFIIDYGSYYKTKLCWLKKDPDENDPDIDDPDYKYWNIFMRNNPTSGNRDDYNTLYKDPSTNEFKGYARDEIYAFSMVLFDKYNNPSNPLWIGDIRFPRNQDIDPINRREIGGKYTDINHPNQGNFNYFNGGYAYPLGLRVSIRSGFLSDNKNGVTSYKIVRCDRGSSGRSPVSSNKSILSFGAIGNIRLAIAMNLSQAANGGKSEAHRWVFSHYPEMGMSNHIDMIDGDQHLNGYDRTDYDEDFINTPSNWVSRWNGVLKESPWSNELCQDTGNYHSRYLYFISPEAQIGLPFSNTQESKDAAKLNADNIGKYFRDATFMEFSNVLSSLWSPRNSHTITYYHPQMQYGRKTSTNIFNIGAGAKFNLPFYPGSMSRIYELRGGRYGYESSTTSDYNKEGWSYTSKFNPFISHDKISTISGEKYPLYRKKAWILDWIVTPLSGKLKGVPYSTLGTRLHDARDNNFIFLSPAWTLKRIPWFIPYTSGTKTQYTPGRSNFIYNYANGRAVKNITNIAYCPMTMVIRKYNESLWNQWENTVSSCINTGGFIESQYWERFSPFMDKVYLSKNSDVLDNNMYPMTARYQQVFPGSAKLTVDDKMNACVMQYYNGGKFPIDNKESIYTAFTEVFPLEGGGAQVYCRPNPNNGNYYTQDWAGNPETYWNPGNSAKLNNRDRHIIRHSNGNYYYVNNQFEESRNYGNLGAITLSGAQYGAAGEWAMCNPRGCATPKTIIPMQFDLPDMCSYDLGTYFYDDNYGADGNPGYSSFSCGWGKWPYISEKNFYTRNLSEIPIVAIRKDNSSQYYGFTYSNRSQRSYITCSSVFNKDVKSIDVYQGDIYICMFEYLHSSCPTMTAGGAQNWHASPGFGVGGSYIIFPIESTLNLNMLTSNQLFSSDKNPDKWSISSQYAGSWVDPGDYGDQHMYEWGFSGYRQDEPMFKYNSAWSVGQENNILKYTETVFDNNESGDEDDLKHFDARIFASEKNLENENIDSWTIFKVSSYKDYDTKYGPINNLFVLNTDLFFWQNSAFGIQSTYPQRTMSDNSSTAESQLVIGDSDKALDRYEYLSILYGNQFPYTISSSVGSIYWYDYNMKSLISFNKQGGITNLSKKLNVQSFISNIDTVKEYGYSAYKLLNLSFDHINNELNFNAGTDRTIIYNEDLNIFTSFYNYLPHRFINTNNSLLSIKNDSIYIHNSMDCGLWYNVNIPSSITTIVNKSQNYTKTFDSVDFLTYSYDSNNKEQQLETFSSVEFFNNIQSTGVYTPTWTDNINKKYNSNYVLNIEKRERGWSAQIPRSINSSTKSIFKDRIRDKYMFTKWVFNNKKDENFRRFIVPFITTNFRYSIR